MQLRNDMYVNIESSKAESMGGMDSDETAADWPRVYSLSNR